MRQAINENRRVQLALIGVLVVAGAFILLKVAKGSGSEAGTASTAAPATTDTAATGTATPSNATSTAPTTDASTTAPAATGGAASVPANLVPGPGLPRGLIPAYHHGKAIVLLVRRAGGIDDRLVRRSVDLLGGSSVGPHAKIYVTRARHIARYAWLTQGVDVSELPALVVLRPRKLTKGTPTATVSYGFRAPASVLQAVKDALYNGPTRPYHP